MRYPQFSEIALKENLGYESMLTEACTSKDPVQTGI